MYVLISHVNNSRVMSDKRARVNFECLKANSHRMRFGAYACVARQKRMRMRNFTQTYPYFGVNWRKAMRLTSVRASDADEMVCVKSSTSSNFLRMSLRKSSNF